MFLAATERTLRHGWREAESACFDRGYMGSYLQVSPTTSTGYTLGPGGTQLVPFRY
jgi:hypothetical protein